PGRQLVGRHVGPVVDPAGDDRAIRIALQELDDHLLADARYVDAAEVGAGPRLADADPARAVLVALALAVPGELHLHPAVLIGPDLLAGRTGHDRALRAGHDRLGRDERRPERHRRGLHLDRAEIRLLLAARRIGPIRVGPDLVLDREDQVLLVLVLARVVDEAEGLATAEAGDRAGAAHAPVRRLVLLEPDLRQLIAPVEVDVARRVAVHLAFGERVLHRRRAPGRQIGARLLEVEAGLAEPSRPDVQGALPLVEMVALPPRLVFAREERHLLVVVALQIRLLVVGQDQLVLTVLVLEEKEDALVLAQALDEVEVGFVVLDAILARGMAFAQLEAVARDRILGEDLLDDVGDRQLLENAAVGGGREEPQPRPHVRPVAGIAAVGAGVGELHDVAVEVARRPALEGHLQLQRRAQDVLEADAVVLAQQLDPVVEQLAQRFPAVHVPEGERVLELGLDDDLAGRSHGGSPGKKRMAPSSGGAYYSPATISRYCQLPWTSPACAASDCSSAGR